MSMLQGSGPASHTHTVSGTTTGTKSREEIKFTDLGYHEFAYLRESGSDRVTRVPGGLIYFVEQTSTFVPVIDAKMQFCDIKLYRVNPHSHDHGSDAYAKSYAVSRNTLAAQTLNNAGGSAFGLDSLFGSSK